MSPCPSIGVFVPANGAVVYNAEGKFPVALSLQGIVQVKDKAGFTACRESVAVQGSAGCRRQFCLDAVVFQKYGIENANGRIYPEDVLRREVDKYQTKIQEKRAIGEANHPSESTIDLSRVAINIIELHWEGHTLVGKMEILVSEGFRRYGIISCQGDQIAHLLLNGIKIGVSSRGLGTVQNKFGKLYVADDYEIVCWDVVSDPSTPNAWITGEDSIPSQYVESHISEKTPIIEKLDKFNDWLNR